MKTIITALLIGALFASCEQAENVNQAVAPKTDVYRTQQPVADYMLGKWVSDPGTNNLIEGSLEITPEAVTVNFPGSEKVYLLQQYTTIMVPDCYFIITWYDANGVQQEVKISDWVNHGDYIVLYLDGVKVAVLRRLEDFTPPAEEPEQPEAPVTPTEPVDVN